MNERPIGPNEAVRIHVVAERTGVPEPTLRAWERRYGVPAPARTATKYRLYAPDDVRDVREMRRLTSRGMPAAEAAKRVRSGRERHLPNAGSTDPYARMCATMLNAVSVFDVDGFERALRETMTFGSLLDIVDHILIPTLRAVGDGWHAGELSLAQEHFVSQQIGALLRHLLRLVADRGEYVVLACVEKERHELGLLAFGVKLASWGYRPIFLGADVPARALEAAVSGFSPALVALAMTSAGERPASARKMIARYARACGACPWIVGGLGADHHAKSIRAHGGLVAPAQTDELREVIGSLRKRGAA